MDLFILIAFLAVVVFFSLYIRYLIGKYREISEDLYAVKVLISAYRTGLESLYGAAMFYGEPTIEKLVENTKDLDKELSYILEPYEFEELPASEVEGVED